MSIIIGPLIVFGLPVLAFFAWWRCDAVESYDEPFIPRFYRSYASLLTLRAFKRIPKSDRPFTYKELNKRLKKMDKALGGRREVNKMTRVRWSNQDFVMYGGNSDYENLCDSIIRLQSVAEKAKVCGLSVGDLTDRVDNAAKAIQQTTEEFR